MKVIRDTREVRERYERLLEESDTASVYQTLDWLLVFESLGCDLVFVETDDGGLIPFVCKGTGLFRRAFSLPYDTYGGPVGVRDGRVSYEDVVRTLAVPSSRLVDFGSRVVSATCASEEVVTHLVDLSRGYETVEKGYSNMNRRALRQADRRGISITTVRDPREVRIFWLLYRRTVKKHGTPPLPLRFFESVFRLMTPKDRASFYLAWWEGRAVAANLVLRYKARAFDWTWGYDERYLQLRPTNALIDRAIRDEVEARSISLNLGASPRNSNGNAQFKENFGAEGYAYRIFSRVGFCYLAARAVRHRRFR